MWYIKNYLDYRLVGINTIWTWPRAGRRTELLAAVILTQSPEMYVEEHICAMYAACLPEMAGIYRCMPRRYWGVPDVIHIYTYLPRGGVLCELPPCLARADRTYRSYPRAARNQAWSFLILCNFLITPRRTNTKNRRQVVDDGRSTYCHLVRPTCIQQSRLYGWAD